MENILTKYLHKYCWRTVYHVEYGNFLANHFSHGIIALYRLSVPEIRIENFSKAYMEHEVLGFKLDRAMPELNTKIADDKEFFELRGLKKNYLGMVHYLLDQIESEDEGVKKEKLDRVLKKYVPSLMDGLAGAAFHPLISLGYALDVSSNDLVIDALAYNCYSNIPLSPYNYSEDLNKNTKILEPSTIDYNKELGLDVLGLFELVRKEGKLSDILEENKDLDWKSFEMPYYGDFGIKTMILAKYAAKELDEYMSCIVANKQKLYEAILSDWKSLYTYLFDSFLVIYNGTGELNKGADFFILHLVTSFWAFGRVAPYLTPEKLLDSLLVYLKAGIITYVIQKCPPFKNEGGGLSFKTSSTSEEIAPNWAELKENLINGSSRDLDDEHKIKIVFTLEDRLKSSEYFQLRDDKEFIEFLRTIAARELSILKWH